MSSREEERNAAEKTVNTVQRCVTGPARPFVVRHVGYEKGVY